MSSTKVAESKSKSPASSQVTVSQTEQPEAEKTSPKSKTGGEESEEESEVLEESPCGRWQKRREEVQQRDVPGIDCAFLAMDTEEGVEVVWNEVRISEKKSSKVQLDKIKLVFDNLIELEHPNIAKFHKYWTDNLKDRPRVVFITEYMSSGSLRQFLKKTKKSNRTLKAWKRWCTQILSALSYLHCCDPPIIHGNLTTDTIFIQHNGLIKIGSVAPDAIYNHVKTYKSEAKNLHYVAPEYGDTAGMTTAVDIYAFGICALEMAALEIPANGDTVHTVGEDVIQKTLESVEDKMQKDFIMRCLEKNPARRPTARELLFHPVLFEVHSLKLLASHAYIRQNSVTDDIASLTYFDNTKVIAEIPIHHQKPNLKHQTFYGSDVLELQKFIIDVRNGVYPLTAFNSSSPVNHQGGRARAATPEQEENEKQEEPETYDPECRQVIRASCQIHRIENMPNLQMTLLLRMDDQMNRQLTTEITMEEKPEKVAEDLCGVCFIRPDDIPLLAACIEETLRIMIHGTMNGSSGPFTATLVAASHDPVTGQLLTNGPGQLLTNGGSNSPPTVAAQPAAAAGSGSPPSAAAPAAPASSVSLPTASAPAAGTAASSSVSPPAPAVPTSTAS